MKKTVKFLFYRRPTYFVEFRLYGSFTTSWFYRRPTYFVEFML